MISTRFRMIPRENNRDARYDVLVSRTLPERISLPIIRAAAVGCCELEVDNAMRINRCLCGWRATTQLLIKHRFLHIDCIVDSALESTAQPTTPPSTPERMQCKAKV